MIRVVLKRSKYPGELHMSTAKANKKTKVLIFYGSTREGRMVTRVGKFVSKVISQENMKSLIFDPKKLPFELLNQPLPFCSKTSPDWLKEANERLKIAEGFIFLCPEYNSLPGPALLNMISQFPRESFIHKPAALLTYSIGPFGGCRAGMPMKAFMHDMGIILIPFCVPIPNVSEAIDENGQCSNEVIANNVQVAMKQLHRYAEGLKKLRVEKNFPSL